MLRLSSFGSGSSAQAGKGGREGGRETVNYQYLPFKTTVFDQFLVHTQGGLRLAHCGVDFVAGSCVLLPWSDKATADHKDSNGQLDLTVGDRLWQLALDEPQTANV